MKRWHTNLVDRSRFILLTRHFFRRLFLNDLVFFEDQMMMKVIGFIAILSVFPAYIAEALLFRYLFNPANGAAWVETTLFMSLIMLLIGLVTLLAWDSIYLDRRDFLNLAPLPLRPPMVFLSKFVSLLMFVGMFVVGINSLSSIVFWMYQSESRSFNVIASLGLFAVHMLSMLTSGLWMFFVLALVAGFFGRLSRIRLFRRVSDFVRFGLIAGDVFLLYVFLIDYRLIRVPFDRLHALKETPTAFVRNFPPLWFSGLYQVLLGDKDPFFRDLASRGLLALAVTIVFFFLVAIYLYGGHLRNSSPAAVRHERLSFSRKASEAVLNRTALRNPVERAVFWFYARSISRSQPHRTKVLSYLACGVGVTLILLVSSGKAGWLSPSGPMLSIPLALSFFLLIGIRDASNIPVNFGANWVFRVTETPNRWRYFAGLRKGIWIFAILPLHGWLFLFYGFIWDWPTAGLHCLYSMAFAGWLTEALFFQHQRIPFGCSYLPGKGKVHYFWALYMFAFLAYIFLPARLEPYFLARPVLFIILGLLFLLVVSIVWVYHKRIFYPGHELVFEDNPEPSLAELFSNTP